MSNAGVHDFAIPHESARLARDLILLRMPLPPRKVRGFIVPEMFRDMAQHNVAAGRIVAMGPLAFTYKDHTGLQKQEASVGDWVIIRPFAGTMMQGGKIEFSAWRYVSSFQDALAVVPADKMPDPKTLLWDEDESQQQTEGAAVDPKAVAARTAANDFAFENRKEV